MCSWSGKHAFALMKGQEAAVPVPENDAPPVVEDRTVTIQARGAARESGPSRVARYVRPALATDGSPRLVAKKVLNEVEVKVAPPSFENDTASLEAMSSRLPSLDAPISSSPPLPGLTVASLAG